MVEEKIKLDLRDKRILYELDINSRQSFKRISKKIKTSKNTVAYKIKRMQDNGLILGYYTLIDTFKLGLIFSRIFINLNNTTIDKEREIYSWLEKQGEVNVTAVLKGRYNLVIMTLTKTLIEFYEFLFKFKKKFKEFIAEQHISFFTQVDHYYRDYFIDNEQRELSIIKESSRIEKQEYDEDDLKILKMLSKNARISTVEMSDILKIPPRTISYRIKRLEDKKIILAYRMNLDVSKIGKQYYKINMKLNSFSKINELIEYIKSNLSLLYIDYTISDFDFEFDVEVSSEIELYKILNELKNSGTVKDYEIISNEKYLKLEYLPQ
jgi:Lrp/AsnC family leucine-responsive transcriptional regulator